MGPENQNSIRTLHRDGEAEKREGLPRLEKDSEYLKELFSKNKNK